MGFHKLKIAIFLLNPLPSFLREKLKWMLEDVNEVKCNKFHSIAPEF